jgi:hypothetical protein
VSPVKYELGSYIPEDDILHSQRRGDLKSYIVFQPNSQIDIGSGIAQSVQRLTGLWPELPRDRQSTIGP